MAPSIFYLCGISPPEITLQHIYRGVILVIALEIVTLLLLFPGLSLWQPQQLLGF